MKKKKRCKHTALPGFHYPGALIGSGIPMCDIVPKIPCLDCGKMIKNKSQFRVM